MIVTPQWKSTAPTQSQTIEIPRIETCEEFLVFDDSDKLTLSTSLLERLNELEERLTTIESNLTKIGGELENYLQGLERNKQSIKLLMQVCEEISK